MAKMSTKKNVASLCGMIGARFFSNRAGAGVVEGRKEKEKQ